MSFLTLTALVSALVVGSPDAQSYDAARKESLDSGKPLMVLVSGDHCPHCLTMKHSTLPQVTKDGAMKGLAFSVVDSGYESGTADKLMEGQYIPQLIIYVKTPKGWKKDVLVGGASAGQVEQFISSNVAKGIAAQPKTPAATAAKPLIKTEKKADKSAQAKSEVGSQG